MKVKLSPDFLTIILGWIAFAAWQDSFWGGMAFAMLLSLLGRKGGDD